jgi:Gti1/Pac2 family transcription factor
VALEQVYPDQSSSSAANLSPAAYFTQATVDRLGTVDDLPGVGDLAIPDGVFKTTRVAKGRSKNEDSTAPRSSDTKASAPSSSSAGSSRTYSSYVPPPGPPEPDKATGQSIQMFQPYPNYNGNGFPGKDFTPPPYTVPSGSRPHPLHVSSPVTDPYYDTSRSSTSPVSVSYGYSDTRSPISVPSNRLESGHHRGTPGPPLIIPNQQQFYNPQHSFPTRMMSPHQPQSVYYPPEQQSPIVNNAMSQQWYPSPTIQSPYGEVNTPSSLSRPDAPQSPYDAQSGFIQQSPVTSTSPYPHLSPASYPPEDPLHQKMSPVANNQYPPLLIPLNSYHDENDSGTESSTSEGRRGEIGASRDLAPLHTLARARLHPYRRDPADDKTLRLLDPKAAPSAP